MSDPASIPLPRTSGNAWLSPEYWRDHSAHRPPIWVVCPSGEWWCPDSTSARGDGGWTVTGDPPNITASPSILCPGYHGYLRDGVFTDDLDGRQMPG